MVSNENALVIMKVEYLSITLLHIILICELSSRRLNWQVVPLMSEKCILKSVTSRKLDICSLRCVLMLSPAGVPISR